MLENSFGRLFLNPYFILVHTKKYEVSIFLFCFAWALRRVATSHWDGEGKKGGSHSFIWASGVREKWGVDVLKRMHTDKLLLLFHQMEYILFFWSVWGNKFYFVCEKKNTEAPCFFLFMCLARRSSRSTWMKFFFSFFLACCKAYFSNDGTDDDKDHKKTRPKMQEGRKRSSSWRRKRRTKKFVGTSVFFREPCAHGKSIWEKKKKHEKKSGCWNWR